jgi:hypothetical protein
VVDGYSLVTCYLSHKSEVDAYLKGRDTQTSRPFTVSKTAAVFPLWLWS